MGGIGFIPWAPGTWGSLISIPLLLIVREGLTGSVPMKIAELIVLFGIVFWLSLQAMPAATGADDPDQSFVVIDEFLGMYVSALPLMLSGAIQTVPFAAAFLLFRIFDIWKPLGIGAMDRQGTYISVLLDDVLAGIAALVVLLLLSYFGLIPIV